MNRSDAADKQSRYCDVVLPHTPLDELTYEIGGLAERPVPGDCVEVPVRGKRVRGVVVRVSVSSDVKNARPVASLVLPGFLDRSLLELLDWIADYYCCRRGEALGLMLPRGIMRGRLSGDDSHLPSSVDGSNYGATGKSASQMQNFRVDISTTRRGRLEQVSDFLADTSHSGGGILLLPEACLAQWLPSLRERFGPGLAEYHSGLRAAQLRQNWLGIRLGKYRLVVGTRSAVFAPLSSPGGIAVVDTHDPVFKEERYPRYNARDIAVVRARTAGCPVLFSDPSPAVETWHSVKKGYYHLVDALAEPRRYPASYIVNMRRSRDRLLSTRFRRQLDKLSDTDSAVCYVNRKGYSRYIVCESCGSTIECPDCRLPMVLTASRSLHCNWCGKKLPPPEDCPGCAGRTFDLRGAGLDMVARELGRLMPGRNIVRVESGSPEAHAELSPGTILVGTRTLLSIPWPESVKLVVVVNFDYEIAVPDYRVRERAFQVLSSLVTRAEAADAAVVLQTRRPEETVLEFGLSRDVEGFMAEELELRREAHLPPFKRLAMITIRKGNRGALLTHASLVKRSLGDQPGVEVNGPVEDRGQSLRLMVRYPRGRSLGRLLDRKLLQPNRFEVKVDVDPKDTC